MSPTLLCHQLWPSLTPASKHNPALSVRLIVSPCNASADVHLRVADVSRVKAVDTGHDSAPYLLLPQSLVIGSIQYANVAVSVTQMAQLLVVATAGLLPLLESQASSVAAPRQRHRDNTARGRERSLVGADVATQEQCVMLFALQHTSAAVTHVPAGSASGQALSAIVQQSTVAFVKRPFDSTTLFELGEWVVSAIPAHASGQGIVVDASKGARIATGSKGNDDASPFVRARFRSTQSAEDGFANVLHARVGVEGVNLHINEQLAATATALIAGWQQELAPKLGASTRVLCSNSHTHKPRRHTHPSPSTNSTAIDRCTE